MVRVSHGFPVALAAPVRGGFGAGDGDRAVLSPGRDRFWAAPRPENNSHDELTTKEVTIAAHQNWGPVSGHRGRTMNDNWPGPLGAAANTFGGNPS